LKRRARSRLELTADILRVAIGGAKKTHIAYGAFLNPSALNDYLKLLTEAGLLKREGKAYKTTEKELKFLQLFEEINKYLPVVSIVEDIDPGGGIQLIPTSIALPAI